MRINHRLAALALGAMLLSSCASAPPSAELTLAKANYAWDAAFNTAGAVYLQWAPTAPADQKAQVKSLLLDKAWPAVQAADAAAKVPGASGTPAQAALVTTAVAQAMSIMQPALATH